MDITRPGWLTTLAVLGIVIGSLGVVGGLQILGQSQAPAEKMERQIEELMDRFPGMREQPKEVRDALKEAIPAMVRVDKAWRNRRVALAVANLLLSGLLLVGCLQALKLAPSGRWLWLNAALALIPVEVLGAITQVLLARDNARVWVEALVKAGDVPQAAGELAVVGRVMVGVAVGIYGSWALLLCVYYGIAVERLVRPATRRLFELSAKSKET